MVSPRPQQLPRPTSVQPPQLVTEHLVPLQSAADASRSLVDSSRELIQGFLHRCNIPYVVADEEPGFYDACCEDAIRRGCPLSGPHSVRPFIPSGVAMATTAYAHLTDQSTRLYIAMYTALLVYVDDVFQHDVTVVSKFNKRFILREPMGDVVLDALADLLRELPRRFDGLVSNIMMTSTLNLLTALLVEDETRKMSISPVAYQYPPFARFLAGAAEAYVLFMFPREIPVTSYFQALPDLIYFINTGNDVLSFYKEELAGETVNCVSLLAACHGVSKHLIVQQLADETAAAHERVLQILKSDPAAYKTYVQFSHGYVGFHAVPGRYRLDELSL